MLESCALHVIRGESRRESVVMVVSTESGVTETQNIDSNISSRHLMRKMKIKPKKNYKKILAPTIRLNLKFCSRIIITKKATMESYLTRRLSSGKPGYEPPSKASSERYRLFVINAVIGFMA